jgi:beta-lactamase regulating signal transducer with metallopeptidase domain
VNIHLLLEAALRSAVMGAIIFAALQLLRIRQVRAQRTAWLLALAGALAMPALVGGQIGPRLLPEVGAYATLSPQQAPLASAAAALMAAHVSMAAPSVQLVNASRPRIDSALALLEAGYFVVAVIFLLRLCVGVGFAMQLRNHAQRVAFRFDPYTDIRVSRRISTPMTIGSSVLLPSDYTTWDDATLRIVLTHERAHVHQRDFYVQLLAGIHCALFWFNPFSWWLQRRLSELGEALSDCAAVGQADSRATYAETLLAFAAQSSRPFAAVAMARASNLSTRIERLLSDRGFRQSFAGRPRLSFVAAGVVVLALIASTSGVKVRAASANDPQKGGETELLAFSEGGDSIYYQYQGKPYLIQDPAILARAREMMAPMKELDRKQKELGREQAALGRQQRALAMQATVKIDTPEFKRALAQVNDVVHQLNLSQVSPQMDQKSLAALQANLAKVQGRLDALQAEVGTRFERLGEDQDAFGQEQSQLGEQQSELGEQQRKIAEDTKRMLKPLIEQAIRDGKARAVN